MIMKKDETKSPKYLDMEDIKRTIFEAVIELKNARNQIGWSIAELSRRSSVSVGVISDLENDKKKVPTLANFIGLTRTLGMSKEFVLGTILDCKLCDKEDNKATTETIINDLRDYGIHDKESIDFIMQTIDFVKARKKNTSID